MLAERDGSRKGWEVEGTIETAAKVKVPGQECRSYGAAARDRSTADIHAQTRSTRQEADPISKVDRLCLNAFGGGIAGSVVIAWRSSLDTAGFDFPSKQASAGLGAAISA